MLKEKVAQVFIKVAQKGARVDLLKNDAFHLNPKSHHKFWLLFKKLCHSDFSKSPILVTLYEIYLDR